MMSVFAGEITKQTRVEPAASIRSSRYSQTARGRSVWPSYRVPTGSSSLEKASGCIRVQSEVIDHITGLRGNQNFSSRLKELFQPFPMIADYRGLTSRGFEQPSRWAISHFSHGRSRNAQG